MRPSRGGLVPCSDEKKDERAESTCDGGTLDRYFIMLFEHTRRGLASYGASGYHRAARSATPLTRPTASRRAARAHAEGAVAG